MAKFWGFGKKKDEELDPASKKILKGIVENAAEKIMGDFQPIETPPKENWFRYILEISELEGENLTDRLFDIKEFIVSTFEGFPGDIDIRYGEGQLCDGNDPDPDDDFDSIYISFHTPDICNWGVWTDYLYDHIFSKGFSLYNKLPETFTEFQEAGWKVWDFPAKVAHYLSDGSDDDDWTDEVWTTIEETFLKMKTI